LPKNSDRRNPRQGDLEALAESIRHLGILQPLVVVGAKTHRLVFGRRRLAAARLAGWEQVPCLLADDLIEAVRCVRAQQDENTLREPLSPTEQVELADELEPLLKKEAGLRQRATQLAGRTPAGTPRRFGTARIAAPKGEARKHLADAIGTNPETLRQAREMTAAARHVPVLYGHLPKMMDEQSVGAAWKHFMDIREAERPRAGRRGPQGEERGCALRLRQPAL